MIMIYVCLKVGYTPSLIPLKLELIESHVVFGVPPLVGNTIIIIIIQQYVSNLCSSKGEQTKKIWRLSDNNDSC